MASAHLKHVTVMMRNITAEMLSVLVSLTHGHTYSLSGIYEATSFAQYSSVMFWGLLICPWASLCCSSDSLLLWFPFRCACSTFTLEDSAICLTSEQSTMDIDRDDDSVLDVYFVSLCSTVSRLHLSQGHIENEDVRNRSTIRSIDMFFAKIFSVFHWLNYQYRATQYNPQYFYPSQPYFHSH